jgi:hypothetical protein
VEELANLVYGSLSAVIGIGLTVLAGRAYFRGRQKLAGLLCLSLTGFSLTPLAIVFWAFEVLTGLPMPEFWPIADAAAPLSLGFLVHAAFVLGEAPRLIRDYEWLTAVLYPVPIYTGLLWLLRPQGLIDFGTPWLNNLLLDPDIFTVFAVIGALGVLFTRLGLLRKHCDSTDVRIQAKWLMVGLAAALERCSKCRANKPPLVPRRLS